MSTIHNRAIIVYTSDYGRARQLWDEIHGLRCPTTNQNLRISSISGPGVNDACFFVIYPDGSNLDTTRNKIQAKLQMRAKEILRKSTAYWVHVSWGEYHQRVIESHEGKVNWPLSAQNAVNTLKHQLRSAEALKTASAHKSQLFLRIEHMLGLEKEGVVAKGHSPGDCDRIWRVLREQFQIMKDEREVLRDDLRAMRTCAEVNDKIVQQLRAELSEERAGHKRTAAACAEARRDLVKAEERAARNLHRAQDPRDLDKIQKLHEKLAEVEAWRKQEVHNIGKLRALVADLLGTVRGTFSVARVLDGPEKADKTYLTFQGESLLKLEKALADVLFETR